MRTLLAACLCAAAAALPAFAAGPAGPVALPAAYTIPVRTAASQTCPGAFHPSTREPRMFVCEVEVPAALVEQAMFEARMKLCDNPTYWNFGPHVRASDKDGMTLVEWACYRMQ